MCVSMSSLDYNFFQALEKNIIEAGKCQGCGACITACMFEVLRLDNQKPTMIEGKECVNCGMCLYLCPAVSTVLPKPIDELRVPLYLQAHVVDSEITTSNPSGGVVTALAYAALEAGTKSIRTVDVDPTDITKVSSYNAYTKKDLLKTTGSKFFMFPLTLDLDDLRRQDISSAAVIGLPCVLASITALQRYHYHQLSKILEYKIGLFCHGALDPIKFQSYLRTLQISSMAEIASLSFTHEQTPTLTIELTSGKTFSLGYDEWEQLRWPACDYCKEYLTIASDVSIGWAGANKSGWQTLVVFTEHGKALVDMARKLNILELEPLSSEGIEQLHQLQQDKVIKAKQWVQ